MGSVRPNAAHSGFDAFRLIARTSGEVSAEGGQDEQEIEHDVD